MWRTAWELRDLISFAVLLSLGYVVGRAVERRHYADIRRREAAFRMLPALTLRRADPSWRIADAHLVSGIAVVSIDYFKFVAASLRNLFGGRVSAYESLLDRARREAILRMQAAAQRRGAAMIVNVHLQISSVSGMKNPGGGARSAEVLAYGTALRLE